MIMAFIQGHIKELLMALLIAGAGWVIYQTIQENGRLEAELETEQGKVQEWEDRFDQLQADRAIIAGWDSWLEEQRNQAREQNLHYRRTLEELRDEITGLKDYLDLQPPPDFREFLCVSGLVKDPTCPDGSGSVSG